LTVVLSVVAHDRLTCGELDLARMTAVGRCLAGAGGLELRGAEALSPADAAGLESTWARRLGLGRSRPAWRLRFRRP
jgi:hypothetical protein